ncbi:hypothetical protein OG350_00790 [Streptomyces achromogenes]|uniref:Uncharacterized protein n=1 Tax=Streptomyces achromogenes TaxID=67255 RepID=A0ABZ1KGK6_STRAH
MSHPSCFGHTEPSRRPWSTGAQANADRSGHYADPATRTAVAASLPDRVALGAALLIVLARIGAPAAGGEPAAGVALMSWALSALLSPHAG